MYSVKKETITHVSGIVYHLTEFISKTIDEHSFIRVDIRDKENKTYGVIYSEDSNYEETGYLDLRYEDKENLLTMYDFYYNRPDLEDKDWKIVLQEWLTYLKENNYIYDF